MAVQNSVRSYLGIAKETTKGTAVQPTDFIPVSASSFKPMNVIDPLYDQGLRGSVVNSYNYIQGRTRSTIDWGGDVFPDTIGYALAGVLGEVSTSGASAPFTHEIALLNSGLVGADVQPISYTITDFYGAGNRNYSGTQISNFVLNFSADGLLQYTAKGTGWLSTDVAATAPSFSTILPTPVWAGTVTIGGVPVSNAMNGNITMDRPVTPIYGISATQNPYLVFMGALTTTGTITFTMEDDSQLLNYINNTQPSIVLDWTQGSGAGLTQISATLTKGAYVVTNIDRSSDFVTISVDINAQANTTDAGTNGYAPIKWTLQNAVTSGTYA